MPALIVAVAGGGLTPFVVVAVQLSVSSVLGSA
jgi:hypothetical protein